MGFSCIYVLLSAVMTSVSTGFIILSLFIGIIVGVVAVVFRRFAYFCFGFGAVIIISTSIVSFLPVTSDTQENMNTINLISILCSIAAGIAGILIKV